MYREQMMFLLLVVCIMQDSEIYVIKNVMYIHIIHVHVHVYIHTQTLTLSRSGCTKAT